MHLTFKDLRKHIIFVLFFLWLMVFFHLWYVYLQSLWQEKAVRWWVFLEWVISSPVNPLPYVWNNYYSKYVQSLLYSSCLDDNGDEELCSIKTSDNKTFTVNLSWDHYWKDDRKITLDDIYFTYNDVIKENSLSLENSISNNIVSIEKKENNIEIIFERESVNNFEFFKKPILPKHILSWKAKDYYTSVYLQNFVNSTCVGFDYRSDFTKNIILNYKNCEDYYINSYQFLFLNDIKEVSNYLTWTHKLDIYNAYENVDPNIFEKHTILKKLRYSFFFNILKQTNPNIKSFLSSKIISELKNNVSISNKISFNWYWLFQLPSNNLTSEQFKNQLEKQVLSSKKNKYKESLENVTWDNLNYTYSWNSLFYIENDISWWLTINGNLWTWWFERFSISQNGAAEYFPSSYDWKTFRYVLSNTFNNINNWKNTYTLYAYNSSGDRQKLDDIVVNYKNIEYPDFELTMPDFTIVYLDEWFISNLWDAISSILENYYPWNIISKKVIWKEYQEILNSWNYDMVVWNVNFDGKDISSLFRTKDPISNPSLFVNQNFASLISNNLLASLEDKKNIFNELDKIYKEFIPMVIIGNEKENIYVNKKYNIDKSLDYSSFENRKKMIKSIIINSIKKPVWGEVSFSWFINFLQKELKN